MIALIWILNFIISIFNAWGCGKTWNETKYTKGAAHFMNWMGAIMSAAGFTWCYLVIAVFLGGTIPVEQSNGVEAPYLNPEQVQAVADLGYMVIILPILGSGLAITVHSWGVFWRRRTIGTGAVTGWNTYAQIYNMTSAMEYIPQTTSRLGGFFNSKDDDGKGKVLLLVLLAAIGGILTTYFIIKKTAEATAINRAYHYDWKRLQEEEA